MNLQWLQLTQLCLGLVIGLVLGYELNLEKSAAIMAKDSCGICQENLGIMVSNFNVLARDCSEAKTYRDLEVLPALGFNQSIRVYGGYNAS